MSELAIGSTFAEHLIRGVAGRGGMGVVYRAVHVPLKREVALKVIAPELSSDGEFRARFRREVESAAAVEHANVIPVFHAGEEDGLLFVTMPFVAGTDLARLIAREGGLEPARAVRIAAQVADALDATHALGLVHRDVKPGNVLLDAEDRVLLTDFGLTKPARSDTKLTETGTLLGSFDYAAPEVFDDAGVDARTDVYSLGCLLFEALTGSVPYPRDTVAAKVFAHLSAPPPTVTSRVPRAPADLDRVLAHALAKVPDDRYATAGELARDALAAVGASSPHLDAPAPAAARAGGELPPQLRSEAALGPFVGRAEALAELERGYASAAEGERRFVLVSGEAGIGKTRLVAEFAQDLHAKGAYVLFGRSDPESLVPYQPFITAIQHYMANRDSLSIPSELRPELHELARFVPALRTRLAVQPEPLAEDPETRRYRLFQAVGRMLGFVARRAPTVLVLDDLQWADSSTALLLTNVWRDPEPIRLLVLATFREPGESPCPELASGLAALNRDPGFSRVALSGLSTQDISALVAEHGGRPARETLVRRLSERTDGNPFFVVETLRALGDGDDLAGVPEGVKDVIAWRLSRLSEAARRALSTAAVVGRDFRLEVLEALLGDSEERTLAAVEEAIAAGLVREVADDVDCFTFAHALIRESLYEGLSGSRRTRLHLAVAETLEGLGAQPAEIAHHLLGSRHLDTEGKAVAFSVEAARRAAASLAYEEAAAHYARALERAESDDAELWLEAAQAQLRAGHPAARESFLRAAVLARAADRPDVLGEAALGVASPYAEGSAVDPAALALLEESLEALAGREEPLVVRLLAAQANNLYFRGELERTGELSQAALELARRLDDPEALVVALQSRHTALLHVSQLEARLRLSEEWLELAVRAGARELEALGLYASIYNRLEATDMATARRELERLSALADELRQPLYQHFAMIWRFAFSQRISESKRLAAAAHELGTRAHTRGADTLYAFHIGSLAYQEERMIEVAPFVVAQLEQNPHLVVQRAPLAIAYLHAGDRAAAMAEFEYVARDDFATVPRDQLWLTTVCIAAEACALIGDADRARVLYELISPYRELNVQSGMVQCLGSAERFLALLAGALGDVEAARAHFEAAVAADEARGLADAAAVARSEYADLLLAHGERDYALTQLEAALAGAEACELDSLAARTRTRISAAGEPPPPDPA